MRQPCPLSAGAATPTWPTMSSTYVAVWWTSSGKVPLTSVTHTNNSSLVTFKSCHHALLSQIKTSIALSIWFVCVPGAYTRDPKEVFEFISKLISQAKRKGKQYELQLVHLVKFNLKSLLCFVFPPIKCTSMISWQLYQHESYLYFDCYCFCSHIN